MNGIDTGSGKSVIISQVAHMLAQADKTVVVVSSSEYLKTQLQNKYFANGAMGSAKITHLALAGADFLKFVYHKTAADWADTYIVADEIDLVVGSERMRYTHASSCNVEADMEGVATTYLLDPLDIFARCKFVIGFCANVEESVRRLIDDYETLLAESDVTSTKVARLGITKPGAGLTFNYGNCKGAGEKSFRAPQFVARSGVSMDDMQKDTLGKVKLLLEQAKAPKCIFVVHGYKSQLEAMRDLITKSPQVYKLGHRKVFVLLDTETQAAAAEFTR